MAYEQIYGQLIQNINPQAVASLITATDASITAERFVGISSDLISGQFPGVLPLAVPELNAIIGIDAAIWSSIWADDAPDDIVVSGRRFDNFSVTTVIIASRELLQQVITEECELAKVTGTVMSMMTSPAQSAQELYQSILASLPMTSIGNSARDLLRQVLNLSPDIQGFKEGVIAMFAPSGDVVSDDTFGSTPAGVVTGRSGLMLWAIAAIEEIADTLDEVLPKVRSWLGKAHVVAEAMLHTASNKVNGWFQRTAQWFSDPWVVDAEGVSASLLPDTIGNGFVSLSIPGQSGTYFSSMMTISLMENFGLSAARSLFFPTVGAVWVIYLDTETNLAGVGFYRRLTCNEYITNGAVIGVLKSHIYGPGELLDTPVFKESFGLTSPSAYVKSLADSGQINYIPGDISGAANMLLVNGPFSDILLRNNELVYFGLDVATCSTTWNSLYKSATGSDGYNRAVNFIPTRTGVTAATRTRENFVRDIIGIADNQLGIASAVISKFTAYFEAHLLGNVPTNFFRCSPSITFGSMVCTDDVLLSITTDKVKGAVTTAAVATAIVLAVTGFKKLRQSAVTATAAYERLLLDPNASATSLLQARRKAKLFSVLAGMGTYGDGFTIGVSQMPGYDGTDPDVSRIIQLISGRE